MGYQAVAHRQGDDVAVALDDLSPGQPVTIHFMDGNGDLSLEVREAISLGHKFALRDLSKGKEVIEYGQPIGEAVSSVSSGTHVHIHNLKSLRWKR